MPLTQAKFLDWLQVEQRGLWDWKLLAEYRFDSVVWGARIIVPAGFETDFASVPHTPLIRWLAGQRANGAAVLHDYLYSVQLSTREKADRLFLEAALTDGTFVGQAPLARWRAALMYAAVHTFGWIFWDRRQRGRKFRSERWGP